MPVATHQPLPTASSIDQAIAAATQDPYNGVPRLVFLAASATSPRLYSGAGGYARVPSPPVPLEEVFSHPQAEPIRQDSIYELFSCTKLVGAIAALQLVEQGKISLDEDAGKYVPQLRDVKILTKWDEEKDEPVLEDNDVTITVRMLLTHTSGAVYFFHDLKSALKLSKHLGIKPAPYSEEATPECLYKMPFFYKPGSTWVYGTSIDWLTRVVEEVSGLDLETYFQKNIFGPLAIEDISFRPFPTQIDMCNASTSPSSPHTFVRPTPMHSKHRYGGAGLHGSPASYLKIVRALLRGGALEEEGSRILKKETVELMFESQLNEVQAAALQKAEVRGSEPFSRAAGVSLATANYGLGGMLTGTGLASGRGARSLHWSGMANTFWVVDRANDVCFVVFSNIIPYGNDQVFALWHTIETELYKGLAEQKKELEQ